jgi:broad specificity phosphatase PhoE/predicted kinase
MALALIMVGLPARGKTYTARKVAHYFSWLGHRTKVFNVGNVRRKLSGSSVPHAFFDPKNERGVNARKTAAEQALEHLLEWFKEGGEIAIFDATNSTRERRDWLYSILTRNGHECAFIESICEDQNVINENIRQTKLGSPDYVGVSTKQATEDFQARIAHYVSAYQPLEEEQVPWIKIIDAGRQVLFNQLRGPLLMNLGHFLMHLNLRPSSIWLSRHGQSIFNTQHRVGGDSNLSPNGRFYASSLTDFMQEQSIPIIWTSTLQRTIQTASRLGRPITQWKILDEIHAGICDGLTYAQIDQQYPGIAKGRADDKLRYRYPQGESYEDLIKRVAPIILAIEQRVEPVLIIAHQAILRVIYGYFSERERSSVPHLSIPLHTMIHLKPSTYGCEEMRFALPPHIGVK